MARGVEDIYDKIEEDDETCYCSKCGRGVHMDDICTELEDYFCETCCECSYCKPNEDRVWTSYLLCPLDLHRGETACECCCCKHRVRGPQYKGIQYTNH